MPRKVDRRTILGTAAALAAVSASGVRPAAAQTVIPVSLAAVLKPIFGDKPIQQGKVVLKMPVVAENGGSVAVGVGVPGTEMPKRLVLVAPQNPQPLATEIHFGPRAARAEATMRLRLARSQAVVAAAEMPDGSVWATSAEVVITSGACIELGE